jgi:hypothetical protein
MFTFGQNGRAAVLVVFLIVADDPVHGHQHPRFREQEAMR